MIFTAAGSLFYHAARLRRPPPGSRLERSTIQKQQSAAEGQVLFSTDPGISSRSEPAGCVLSQRSRAALVTLERLGSIRCLRAKSLREVTVSIFS